MALARELARLICVHRGRARKILISRLRRAPISEKYKLRGDFVVGAKIFLLWGLVWFNFSCVVEWFLADFACIMREKMCWEGPGYFESQNKNINVIPARLVLDLRRISFELLIFDKLYHIYKF